MTPTGDMWGPATPESNKPKRAKGIRRWRRTKIHPSSPRHLVLESPWYRVSPEFKTQLNSQMGTGDRAPQKEARIRRGWRIALTSIFGLLFLASIANLFFPHTKKNPMPGDIVQIIVFGSLMAVVQWRLILRRVRINHREWNTNRKAWTTVLGVVLLLQIVSGVSSYRRGASLSTDIVGAVFWLTLIVGVQLIFIWRMSRRSPHRSASTIGNRLCGSCGSPRASTKFCGSCGGFLGG